MTTITGLSRLGEKAAQERMLDASERKLYSQFREELLKVYAQFARDGRVSSGVMSAHKERVAEILAVNHTNIFNQFGMRILTGKKSYKDFETKADIPKIAQFDEARRAWILEFGAEKVTQITGTTEEQAQSLINRAIAQAVADGLGEIETANLIKEFFIDRAPSLSKFRSRVIARTEAHTASQSANQIAAELSGDVSKKIWASSSGERTRPNHRRADGQEVGLNETFKVGKDKLRYCGDPLGSAKETINCRCITLYE